MFKVVDAVALIVVVVFKVVVVFEVVVVAVVALIFLVVFKVIVVTLAVVALIVVVVFKVIVITLAVIAIIAVFLSDLVVDAVIVVLQIVAVTAAAVAPIFNYMYSCNFIGNCCNCIHTFKSFRFKNAHAKKNSHFSTKTSLFAFGKTLFGCLFFAIFHFSVFRIFDGLAF